MQEEQNSDNNRVDTIKVSTKPKGGHDHEKNLFLTAHRVHDWISSPHSGF
jgi:hypothetical protein